MHIFHEGSDDMGRVSASYWCHLSQPGFRRHGPCLSMSLHGEHHTGLALQTFWFISNIKLLPMMIFSVVIMAYIFPQP